MIAGRCIVKVGMVIWARQYTCVCLSISLKYQSVNNQIFPGNFEDRPNRKFNLPSHAMAESFDFIIVGSKSYKTLCLGHSKFDISMGLI